MSTRTMSTPFMSTSSTCVFPLDHDNFTIMIMFMIMIMTIMSLMGTKA